MSEFIAYRELVTSHDEEAADWVLASVEAYGPPDDPYFPRDAVEDALDLFEPESVGEEVGEP